jgi:hypothetical protein
MEGLTMRKSHSRLQGFVCLLTCLLCGVSVTLAQDFPALDPPKLDRSNVLPDTETTHRYRFSIATTEWTFHKTADGQHPDGVEQARLWLVNRARQDPTAEGIWLASSDEEDIAGGRTFFNVDINLLQSEFAAIDPKPPAAFDVRLYEAARAHSEALIARNSQDHEGQFDLIDDAGFLFARVRGNVFSFARNALHAHAAFNIDWGGNDGTGMQPGRGHRQAIMAIDGNYTNVGIASVPEDDAGTDVGPLVMTGNYAEAFPNVENHFNRFVVGTVWQDLNGNYRYDPGEGFADVTVMPDQGTYFAITAAGGGYAIPITTPGEYTLTFSGANIGADVTRSVIVSNDSVLLDYQVGLLPLAGDVNEDGDLSADDARWVLRYFVGLQSLQDSQRAQANINQDSSVTPADALCIFQEFIGLPSCLD